MTGERTGSKGRYAFVSLGCPKNLVDSERMLGLLQLEGYELVDDPDGTDFVVVNTCGFIEQAREESFAAIDEMLQLKRDGKTRGVIVSGCLAERQKESLLAERPEIDTLVGVFAREQVTEVADRLVGHLAEQRAVFRPAPIRALPDRDRLRVTPKHFAYLKISEGCDRLCTFCAIPKMRGKHASKPMEEVVAEARQLADDGVRELIIVAQDTTYYGVDLYGRPRLTELLTALETVDVDWIRLMYLYPMYLDQPLIDAIARADKIVPYIDLPLQHINDRMLRRMARRVTRAQTQSLLEQLRRGIPHLTLRTTFITGFPGETDREFEELADFVRAERFERLGVFTYSPEEQTPAVQLADPVPPAVRQARRDRLMEIQQQIVTQHQQQQVGQTCEVIIDRPVPDADRAWIGRTPGDAPDVDGLVFVTEGGEQPLRAGAITRCEIVAAQSYDLIGVGVGQPWLQRAESTDDGAAGAVLRGLRPHPVPLLLVGHAGVPGGRVHRLGGRLLGPAVWPGDEAGPRVRPVCRQVHHLRRIHSAGGRTRLRDPGLDGGPGRRSRDAGDITAEFHRTERGRFLRADGGQAEDGLPVYCGCRQSAGAYVHSARSSGVAQRRADRRGVAGHALDSLFRDWLRVGRREAFSLRAER